MPVASTDGLTSLSAPCDANPAHVTTQIAILTPRRAPADGFPARRARHRSQTAKTVQVHAARHLLSIST